MSFRVAIIGGGITGLAAVHRLAELARDAQPPIDLAISLFEASGRLGGIVRSERRDGYLIEHGPDSFITNKPGAIELCRRIGLESELIGTEPGFRTALVLKNGRPLPVPEGFMLMVPAKVGPVLRSRIFTPWGKLRMGLECLIPRKVGDGDESLASFVRRRFGREALDRLVQPLVGGIYTADPERLSLRATLPRFLEMEQRYRSLILGSRREPAAPAESGARYGMFVTLRDGLSRLVESLRTQIGQAGEIHLSTRVSRIEACEGGGVDLTFANSERPVQTAHFDALIVATPAHVASELVESFDTSLAAALAEIEYASSAVVVTGHALSDVAHPLDAAGLVIPAREGRSILSVSFASRKFAGRAPVGRVLLRTFVGGALQPEMLDRGDDELIEIVRRELQDIFGMRGAPDFASVTRYRRAMPQYHVGHLDRVRRIERFAAAHPWLNFAGTMLGGVGLPDCIASGERAAERTITSLGSRPPLA